MLLRFDGASKGNPGLGGSAAELYTDNKISAHCYYYHSTPVTNNIAEYHGLIIGLQLALSQGHLNIFVEGDSKLVIEQCFGKWKCAHPNMIPLHNKVVELKKRFKSIHGQWIPREKNGDADKYSNEAVDKRAHFGLSDTLHPTSASLPITQTLRQLTLHEAFKKAKIT